ncbi:MAG: citrate synthase [Pirellulales bacterium]
MGSPSANGIRTAPAAKLTLGDKTLELPVVIGSEDEPAVDITKLRAQSGYVTLDDGYMNTGATTSAITYLDGEQGILRYRGYPIEELAEKCDFVEVSYLLIYGELPTSEQLETFKKNLKRHTMLHEDMKSFYNGFPRDAHPMAILGSVVGALSTFYQDSLDPHDPNDIEISVHRLMAKLPTIAAYSHKKSVGQPFNYPNNAYGYCENFLQMMFAVPSEEYKVDPDFVSALQHAVDRARRSRTKLQHQHGPLGRQQRRQPLRVDLGRHLRLWGPLHGGANQACVEMLEKIRNDGGNVKKYVDLAKNKESGFRLMGFGHRVYKNFDPRATIIKGMCDKLLKKRSIHDPIFDIAQELEQVALHDSYFIERKLYPNVDFYSGVIYRAMGIPVQMFTVLFAMGRLPGWIAHWMEMQAAPGKKIGRPRQIYTGPVKREFTPIDKRK